MLRRLNEETTALYTGQLVDENGADLQMSALNTFTLTLYDLASGTIINGRDNQDVLNVNNVTVSPTGAVLWTLQPDDNPILDDTLDTELHVALFRGTYATTKELKHEFRFRVINLEKVS